jgi:hypothetical protein
MKTVFSNASDCIHAYAQRPNDPTTHGRSGNVYFEGGSLYSFGSHYELAKWIDNETVLIDDRGYSKTTAKHIGKAQHALSQYRQFYTLETDPQHVAQQLRSYRQKLATARKPELYTVPAVSLIGRYVEWLDYTGKTIAPELIELIQHFTSDGMKERINADRERIEAQRKKDERKRQENERLFREAFNTYEPFGIYRAAAGADYDLIRFKQNDPTIVETSQNVKTPYSVALEAFTRLKRAELMKGQHVAGFTVHAIEPEYIRIGCHRFLISDLETFFAGA